MTKYFYTKRESENLLRTFNCAEPLPKKNMVLYIAFADGSMYTVQKSEYKSTEGKTLYEFDFHPKQTE